MLSGTLILELMFQTAALSWDRPIIKSMEEESQVFELCRSGDELINSRNYSQALQVYKQAARYDPSSYSCYVHENLAKCYGEMKQYPQALNEGQASLRYDPKYGGAYYQLALTYFKCEQYETAGQYLRKLLAVTQDQKWIGQAKQLLEQIDTYGKVYDAVKQINAGKYNAAVKMLKEAATHDPSPVSENVHYNLTYALRQMGNAEQALVEGKKTLQLNKNSKDAMYCMALCYQDIGKFAEAIDWLRKYCELETDSTKREKAAEMISSLINDKDKVNDEANNLPDYFVASESSRWSPEHLPLKVFVNEGTGVQGYKPHYRSYVNRAMDAWCKASGGKLSYTMVNSAKAADLTVTWLCRPIKLNEGGKLRVKQGDTKTYPYGSAEINHADVELNCMHMFDAGKELESGQVASLCMHEIGHALGLDHSSNFNDVMYFGASAKQKSLPTSRDKNTIAHLYVKYPVSSLTPVGKEPEPISTSPPPGFLPPRAPTQEDLQLPVFVPPPLVDESEKLTPPFFKPAPIDDADRAPLPPSFLPPPLKDDKKNPGIKPANKPAAKPTDKPSTKKNPTTKIPARKEDGGIPFFVPPEVK